MNTKKKKYNTIENKSLLLSSSSSSSSLSLSSKNNNKTKNDDTCTSPTFLINLIVGGGLLLRIIVSGYPYSGYQSPPMFGDFEAQRHWQEVTVNHPIQDWYENKTTNDLDYWGLDYPPLTAYHSWALGKLAKWIDNSYVELFESRGITNEYHKHFMRFTVLLADVLIYFPSLIICCQIIFKLFATKELKHMTNDTAKKMIHLIVLIYYPGQILIDNGHFQYNNISLGLAVLAIIGFFTDSVLYGSVAFVFALNYKQMELYHALPIFFYLLAKCFNDWKRERKSGIINLLKIGSIVLISFTILWLPWILHSLDSTVQVVNRIFPVARGVFEDKVANFWCFLNVFIRIKTLASKELMAIICAIVTIFSVSPSCICLFRNPQKKTLLLSLINVSLGFFLFSYQVHEKSILLVTLPVALYFPVDPLPCLIFLQTATFSMTPLLYRDDLIAAYVGLSLIFMILIKFLTEHFMIVNSPKLRNTGDDYSSSSFENTIIFKYLQLLDLFKISNLLEYNNNSCYPKRNSIFLSPLLRQFFILFYYGTTILQIICLYALVNYQPPFDLPHLIPVLISIKCAVYFGLFFVYFNLKQMFDCL